MKKIVCILLVALLAVSLCSCSSDLGESLKNTESTANTESKADTQTLQSTDEFALGEISGNTYTNTFLGLSCTLPSDWVFATEDEIKEMNNTVGDYLDDEMKDLLEQANIVYDMSAQYSATGSTINVNMEKLTSAQLSNLNIQQVLEAQFAGVKSTFENMGYTDVSVKYDTVVVDGKTMDAMVVNATIQGNGYYATSFVYNKGNYLVSVAVGSVFDDNTQTYLGYFDLF